jgi:anionic cell wall polymer biosynthesis LytR-Cps2A-Psr (LCP) family protein
MLKQWRKMMKKLLKKISVTDVVLVVIAIYIVIFNHKMIQLFESYQTVPDVLITVLYGVTFGELGFCTMIYKHKKKVKEESTDGIHGSDVLPEVETNGDQRYEELEDTGKSDSSSGVHRKQKRKFWFN